MIIMHVDDNAMMEEYRKEQLKTDGVKTPREFIERMHLKISSRAFRKRFREWCLERGINPSVDPIHYLRYLMESLKLPSDVSDKVMSEYLRLKNIFALLEVKDRDENTEMAIASVVVARTTGKRIDEIITAFAPVMSNLSSDRMMIKRNAMRIFSLLREQL